MSDQIYCLRNQNDSGGGRGTFDRRNVVLSAKLHMPESKRAQNVQSVISL